MYCYIHIPFCTSRCSYCRFATFANFDGLAVSLYVDFLCQSVKLRTGPEKRALKSVYFGWGTPSILSSHQIQKILESLQEVYWFSTDIEITLETTPQNITEIHLKNWQKIGINRISTGIQSLNDKTLHEIGRIQKQDIFNTMDILKHSPIENIALDFIIWLPYTKRGEVSTDISTIFEKYSFIKHFSVYMLEEYTYPKNWEQNAFPKEDINEEYIQVRNTLHWLEFKWYELSNFAIPWFECQHNKAYWNHSDVRAFWLGSHGFEQGVRYSHAENFSDFYTWKWYQQEILDEEAIRIEKIMFWIRTSGFDEQLLNLDWQKKCREYCSLWFLEKNGSLITLWESWFAVMDSILAEII